MAAIGYFELGTERFAVLSFPRGTLPESANLTPAERAVARLVLQGQSNADIATARNASASTIAKQIASVFRKLRVESRADLAVLCCV